MCVYMCFFLTRLEVRHDALLPLNTLDYAHIYVNMYICVCACTEKGREGEREKGNEKKTNVIKC